jgi:hypothetical protein
MWSGRRRSRKCNWMEYKAKKGYGTSFMRPWGAHMDARCLASYYGNEKPVFVRVEALTHRNYITCLYDMYLVVYKRYNVNLNIVLPGLSCSVLSYRIYYSVVKMRVKMRSGSADWSRIIGRFICCHSHDIYRVIGLLVNDTFVGSHLLLCMSQTTRPTVVHSLHQTRQCAPSLI